MRVLLIGPSLFMPWTIYTARALRRLGHSAAVSHYTDIWVDRFTLRRGKEMASPIPWLAAGLERGRALWHESRDRRLIRLAARIQPDRIVVLHGESLSADLLSRLRRSCRGPVVAWWQDDPFRYGVEKLLPLYDTLFLFDRSYLAPVRALGAKDVRFLPCACDETVYRPLELRPWERRRYGCDIAMVGWFYPQRAELLQALSGMEIKVWGKGWKSAQAGATLNGGGRRIVPEERFVPDRETARIYNAARIGLNVHAAQTREAGLNSRAFDLPAAGTFQLCDAVPGMEELLEPGKELAVYRSPAEAREMADYYLRHPREREAIAARGRERVLREHTYLHRVRALVADATGA